MAVHKATRSFCRKLPCRETGDFTLCLSFLVTLDKGFHANFLAELADKVVGNCFHVFEANAGLTDIGLGRQVLGVLLQKPIADLVP